MKITCKSFIYKLTILHSYDCLFIRLKKMVCSGKRTGYTSKWSKQSHLDLALQPLWPLGPHVPCGAGRVMARPTWKMSWTTKHCLKTMGSPMVTTSKLFNNNPDAMASTKCVWDFANQITEEECGAMKTKLWLTTSTTKLLVTPYRGW
jgi:hypothetical protein